MDSGDSLCRGAIDWGAGDNGSAERRLRSSLFAELIQPLTARTHGEAVGVAVQTMEETCLPAATIASEIIAVGHRVVHRRKLFRERVLIDESVRTAIAELALLAPLHNPPALAAIEATEAALPGALQVAVFDTAFSALCLPRLSSIHCLTSG